jgi:hypothetical protein
MTIEITESAAFLLIAEVQEKQVEQLELGFRKTYHVYGMVLTEVYNYIPRTKQFYLTDINA